MEEAVNNKGTGDVRDKRRLKRCSGQKSKKKKTKQVSDLIQREMQTINQNLNKMETKFVKKIQNLEKKQKRLRTESKQKTKASKKRNTHKLSTKIDPTLFLDPITQKLFTPQITRKQCQTPISSMMQVSYGNMNGGFFEMEEKLRKSLQGEIIGIMDRKLMEKEGDLRKEFDGKMQRFMKKCEK